MKNKKLICVSSQLIINKFMPNSKCSQIWVETAIYTLIGLTIIAMVLAIANPQIEKIKDRSSVKQAMQALETLDGKISEVEQSIGSVAIPHINIGRGKIIINATNDSISYLLENTLLEFSQSGLYIKEGDLIVRTDKKGSKFNIFIVRYYQGINIMYNGEEKNSFLEPGAVPYKIRMENKGQDIPENKIIIDFNKI